MSTDDVFGTHRCHASIEEARVVPVGLTPEQVAALTLRERIADIRKLSQCVDWTLSARPGQTCPMDWGQLADMTQPPEDLLTAFQAGQAGPGVVALAQQPDAEIETVWLIGEVMLARIDPDDNCNFQQLNELCDLLDALALYPGTDPAWGQSARQCTESAREMYGSQWHNAVEEQRKHTQPDSLRTWIREQLRHAPRQRHHFW